MPVNVDLEAVAARATYIGSREHKNVPSYAGSAGRRADASCCPPELANDLDRVTGSAEGSRADSGRANRPASPVMFGTRTEQPSTRDDW